MEAMRVVKGAWLAPVLFVLTASGCADRASSSADSPPFPKLASYDRSCLVDGDCALVPGEGCASCDHAALGANAASSYAMAVAAASRDSACQSMFERASPCSVVHVTARCEASLCVVKGSVADAGADADADASPLDASSD
jgi:hypothetical protein